MGYSVSYTDTSAFDVKVNAWQGLRMNGDGQYLITGTSHPSGLVYVGPLNGGGTSYFLDFPEAKATSAYGPDDRRDGTLRVVGSYQSERSDGVFNHGFAWEGTLADLAAKGGTFQRIDYPGAKYQFTHSTMGGLAVGNADIPTGSEPIGPGIAYIYDVVGHRFVKDIAYPNAKSTTAYGIWYDGGTRYVICGGFSPIATNNLKDPTVPLPQGRAFLVDFDLGTDKFSNWTPFDYPAPAGATDVVTHFQGISSVSPGIYTLSADAGMIRTRTTTPTLVTQGAWVQVARSGAPAFVATSWVDLDYQPRSEPGLTSSNSVYGNAVVGIVLGRDPMAYQAMVNLAPQG